MKCVIYLRTSTLEQHPEKQRQACLEFAKSRGYEVKDIFLEQISGFKQIVRPNYDKVKEMAHRGEISAVIVWALDRWVRNRDTLLEDVTLLKSAGVKLHSVQEQWLEAINIEGAIGKTLQEFLLGLVGSLAEMESQRKSERIKMAYRAYKNDDRKFKKWGRKKLPQRVIDEIRERRKKGESIRCIAKEVKYYDKNNNERNVSVGTVATITKLIDNA